MMNEKEHECVELRSSEVNAHSDGLTDGSRSYGQCDADSPAFAHLQGQANFGQINSQDTANGVPNSGYRSVRLPSLPYGELIFTFILIGVIGLFGNYIETWHLATIAQLAEMTNNPNWLDARVEYINSLGVSGSPMVMMQLLVAECEKKFGISDPRTGYAQLIYANYLYRNTGKLAFDPIEKALPSFRNYSVNVPAKATDALQNMARVYQYNHEYKNSIPLFEAAIRLWPHLPGSGTLTNACADLADSFENLNDYANAYKYMKMALDGTLSWGNTDYNVYRMYKLAFYSRMLKDYDLAVKYANDAIAMANRFDANNDWARLARQQLSLATAELNGQIEPSRNANTEQHDGAQKSGAPKGTHQAVSAGKTHSRHGKVHK